MTCGNLRVWQVAKPRRRHGWATIAQACLSHQSACMESSWLITHAWNHHGACISLGCVGTWRWLQACMVKVNWNSSPLFHFTHLTPTRPHYTPFFSHTHVLFLSCTCFPSSHSNPSLLMRMYPFFATRHLSLIRIYLLSPSLNFLFILCAFLP